MSGQKVTIDPSITAPGVSVKADALVIDFDEDELAKGPGVAIARAIADGIRSKGDTWNRSGKLASGIRAKAGADGGQEISAPSDRLTRDPRLLGMLVADVPEIGNPLADTGVQKAIEASVEKMITVNRKR